jgi:hypothetical protein
MPSNRLPRRLAGALRDIATHAHMRAELLPRLPFVVALVVALVALVAAIEHRPKTDARTVAVEEQTSADPEEFTDEPAFTEEQVELEIVESGFSKVTVADQEYVLAAVVVDNPHDGELAPGGLSIFTETERGYPINLDTMFIGWVPPHSTAVVGYVMSVGLAGVDVENLSIKETEPSMLYPSNYLDDVVGGDSYEVDMLPSFEFTGLQPLASPDGYRVRFRADAPAETDAQISVLFRDSEGKLLGGLPADTGFDDYTGAIRTFPAGESEQYIDVTEEWIPEGADLDRIEVGPSRY